MSRPYCGKCKRICDIIVSRSSEPIASEFWGTARVDTAEEVAVLSWCCMYVAYMDAACTIEFELDNMY